MSNHLAIAAVTAGMYDRVVAAVRVVVADAKVRVGVPRGGKAGSGLKVCVCLYRVSHNGAVRNAPVRRGEDGGRVVRPPVVVDLHYIVSFMGSDGLGAEVALGCVLSAMESAPMLTAQEMEQSLRASSLAGQGGGAVTDAPLGLPEGGLEVVVEALTLDELGALWAGWFGKGAGLSLQYVVRGVRIDVG